MKLLKIITLWIPLAIFAASATAAFYAKGLDISEYCSYDCGDLQPGHYTFGCNPEDGISQCMSKCRPINFNGGVCLPTDAY